MKANFNSYCTLPYQALSGFVFVYDQSVPCRTKFYVISQTSHVIAGRTDDPLWCGYSGGNFARALAHVSERRKSFQTFPQRPREEGLRVRGFVSAGSEIVFVLFSRESQSDC